MNTLYLIQFLLACATSRNLQYTIVLKSITDSRGFGNTDDVANMRLKITGSKGSAWKPGNLDDSSRNDLENGAEDDYTFTMQDIGVAQSVTITTGGEDAWCPEYIYLISNDDPIPVHFESGGRQQCLSTDPTEGLGSQTYYRSH